MAPEGERFSLVYLRSETVLRDSDRMRLRLARVFQKYAERPRDNGRRFGRLAERELGVPICVGNGSGVDFDFRFRTLDVRDVLDLITVLYGFISEGFRSEFVETVDRIFSETQVGYRMDQSGGVHPYVDQAFEMARVSAIASLGGEGFEVERQFVSRAEDALMSQPLEGRQAIRSIFDALENLFKRMYSVNQLNGSAITKHLKADIDRVNQNGNSAAKTSSAKSVQGFKEWVDGCHPYRHASGEQLPTEPGEEHVILMLSLGFGYLRWLARVYSELRQ